MPSTSDFGSREIAVPLDLEHAGPYITGIATAVGDELRDLRLKLEPLLSSGWTGAAAAEYTLLQSEWNAAAEGLLGEDGVLGRIAEAMNVTWKDYEYAEWANTETWRHPR